MASLNTPDPNQEQQPTGAVAPAGGGATAGAKASPSPSTAAPGNPGTPATNVGAYLAANAPATQNFANNITGQLNGQYQGTENAINTAASNFNGQVNAGYTPQNNQVVQQAASNPTQFVKTPGNVQEFLAQANDQYTGPSQFETNPAYTSAQGAVTAATNNASPYQSFSGTEAQLAGLGDTTTGEQALDATLLAQTPGANQEIQNAASQISTLPTYLSNVAGVQDADVIAAQNNAAAASQAANAAIGQTAATENTNIGNELTAAQQAEAAYNQSVNSELNTATPIYEAINNAKEYLNNVPNYNLSDWEKGLTNPLTEVMNQTIDTQNPTAANVATPKDYAEEQALAELMGGTYNPAAPLAGTNQAGTFINPGAPVSNDVNSAVQNYLLNTLNPAFQTETNLLTNPSPGSDQAAAMLEAEETNYLNSILAADPSLGGSVGNGGLYENNQKLQPI